MHPSKDMNSPEISCPESPEQHQYLGHLSRASLLRHRASNSKNDKVSSKKDNDPDCSWVTRFDFEASSTKCGVDKVDIDECDSPTNDRVWSSAEPNKNGSGLCEREPVHWLKKSANIGSNRKDDGAFRKSLIAQFSKCPVPPQFPEKRKLEADVKPKTSTKKQCEKDRRSISRSVQTNIFEDEGSY